VSALDQMIHAKGGAKPFREFTVEDVTARADELGAASSAGGPAVRIIPVAQAWGELARTMGEQGAATVEELGESAATERAERLWVIPPGGSLLSS
jgi:hypothetical protein